MTLMGLREKTDAQIVLDTQNSKEIEKHILELPL